MPCSTKSCTTSPSNHCVFPKLRGEHTHSSTDTKHPAAKAPGEWHTPLSQCLLLIDAHVEEDWLHPQQHATLDLSGQGVKQWSWQGDSHIKAITREERKSRGEVGH